MRSPANPIGAPCSRPSTPLWAARTCPRTTDRLGPVAEAWCRFAEACPTYTDQTSRHRGCTNSMTLRARDRAYC